MDKITKEQIHALYFNEIAKQGTTNVNTRRNPLLNEALARYAKENGCTYDEALLEARTGRNIGK